MSGIKYLLLVVVALTVVDANVEASITGAYTDPKRVELINRLSKASGKMVDLHTASIVVFSGNQHALTNSRGEIVDFQRDFDEYLKSYEDFLAMTAEIYGMYYELDQTIKCIRSLNTTIDEVDKSNIAASLLSARNIIYQQLYQSGTEIVRDIKKVFENDSRMTQKERFEMLLRIRPKFKVFNKKIRALDLTIRYTSLATVWDEIRGRAYGYKSINKKTIAENCLRSWMTNMYNFRTH